MHDITLSLLICQGHRWELARNRRNLGQEFAWAPVPHSLELSSPLLVGRDKTSGEVRRQDQQ